MKSSVCLFCSFRLWRCISWQIPTLLLFGPSLIQAVSSSICACSTLTWEGVPLSSLLIRAPYIPEVQTSAFGAFLLFYFGYILFVMCILFLVIFFLWLILSPFYQFGLQLLSLVALCLQYLLTLAGRLTAVLGWTFVLLINSTSMWKFLFFN